MTSTLFRNRDSRSAMLGAYERLLKETPEAHPAQVATRFGDTHLLVAGREDAPPLVVLHGAMANSAMAIREAHSLFERFRVYVVDVIGHSVKSADVRLRLDNADYAEWLRDVLDALGLSAPHVYGASLGAFVARKLAELAPERIERLVLLVPAGIVSAPLLRSISQAGIPLILYKTTGSQAALERFVGSIMTSPDEALFAYLSEALAHYKLDISVPPLGTPEPLRAFARPTLIIGASDDITCPAQALLQRAPELFPHATIEILPNCKHIPPTDPVSRKRLCDRVSRFLLG